MMFLPSSWIQGIVGSNTPQATLASTRVLQAHYLFKLQKKGLASPHEEIQSCPRRLFVKLN